MMFRSLRNLLLVTYSTVIVVMFLALAGLLPFVLALSQRQQLTPKVEQLLDDHRQTINGLRDFLNEEEVTSIDQDAIYEELSNISSDLNGRILIVRLSNSPGSGGGGGGNNNSGNNSDTNNESPPIVIYDSLGTLTGQELPEFERIPSDLIGSNNFQDPDAQLFRFDDPDSGNEWIAYSRPIRASRRLPLRGNILINATPSPSALGTFFENFLSPIAIAGLGALALSIIFSYVVSRRIARPLQTVSRAAEEIAEGNYDQQLAIRGPREIESLADSFNRMSREVKATQLAQRDFIANVSHDLKTPLTSIQGWSQAILDGAVQAEQLPKAAEVIHQESERMGRMVQQLLALAKLEAGRIEFNQTPVQLNSIAKTVQRSLQFQANEKEIDLSVWSQNGFAEDLIVVGDEDQLIQLLTNLVQNGLNHTSSGGSVSIELFENRAGSRGWMVRDTGTGISPEDQERIFERFYQVDKARAGAQRGTGLGLSIVKQIADQHEATLSLDSEPGQGSTFTVTFPPAKSALNGSPSHTKL